MIRIFLCSFLFLSASFSNQLSLQSSEYRTNIIELYTSQGCSSCPVADEWLSQLKNHNDVFRTFIPMAFHVTYWDFIGWKDSFANVMNDNRQRNYSQRVWQKNSVYTPQFVINAKEYRQWFSSQHFPHFSKEYAGVLKVDVDNKNLEVTFNTKSIKSKKVYLNIAILGFDYKVSIKSGENEDRVLHHDFVVLKHYLHFANIANGKLDMQKPLPVVKNDSNKKALAVWLSDEQSNIIQATAGYFDY